MAVLVTGAGGGGGLTLPWRGATAMVVVGSGAGGGESLAAQRAAQRWPGRTCTVHRHSVSQGMLGRG